MGEQKTITVYSTGCPNCKMLESMLDGKGIKYEVNNSEQAILDLGYSSAPLLKVGEEVFTFYQAVKWLQTQPSN